MDTSNGAASRNSSVGSGHVEGAKTHMETDPGRRFENTSMKKAYWPREMPHLPPASRPQDPAAAAPSAPSTSRVSAAIPAATPASRSSFPKVPDEVDVVTSDLIRPARQPRAVSALPGPIAAVAAATVLAPEQSRNSSPGTETPMRRRGRPRGWRPGMSYATMRGNPSPARAQARIAATGSEQPGRRRGRPPKLASPPPQAIYRSLQADFLAYLCEWRGCRAELHNLDTLRRHIYKVHTGTEEDEGEHHSCRWAECALDGAGLRSAQELGDHVERAHLVPMSWHVGDGPDNTSGRERKRKRRKAPGTANEEDGDEEEGEEEEIPDYLRDRHGKQVTPSVAQQRVEDLAAWQTSRRKLRELLRRRDENLPSEESDESDGDEGDEEGGGGG